MHCHVLSHMMMGMMESLLVVNGGELALALPVGVPCEMEDHGGGMPPGGGAPMTSTVTSTGDCKWRDDTSGTPETTIMVGGTVTWKAAGCEDHTVVRWEDQKDPAFALKVLPGSKTFNVAGDYKYICGIHGGNPETKAGMWGIVHVVP